MKRLIIISIILLATVNVFSIGNSPYETAMYKQLALFEKAKSLEDYQAVANGFERIANKETKEWLPLYYAGLAYATMGYNSDLTLQEKDNLYAKAEELAGKAEEISSGNSEITTLQGFIIMGKLAADGANRGQSLSPVVMQLFGKAISQNPENPRALYLMAEMEFGTARFFGTGTEKACGMLHRSIELYEKQPEEETIFPSWGEEEARESLTGCK